MTGRGVAFELGLVEFDEVLGLPPRAIVELLGPLGGAAGQRGDEGTDVHSQRRGVDAGFDAGDGSALEAAPAFGGMGPVQGQVLLGPERRAGVRCRGEQRVAPLAAALMAGQTGNRRCCPRTMPSMRAGHSGRHRAAGCVSRASGGGCADRAADRGAGLDARGCPGRAEHDGEGTRALGFMDRDRRETPRAPWNPFQNATPVAGRRVRHRRCHRCPA